MEISKELLSEVLGEDVRLGEYNIIDNDGVPQKYNMKITLNGTTLNYWRYYKEWDDGSTMVSCQINIYELAFKCKVWAVENNRELYSSSRGHCYISNLNRNNPSNTIDHYAETEVEATIKACEYILKEINGN